MLARLGDNLPSLANAVPKGGDMIWRAIRATVYASLFFLGWGWLALLTRRLDPLLGVTLADWVKPIGIVLMALGVTLALACAAVFVTRGRGTPAPFDPPQEFVVYGPYRWVRNPMYVGGLTLLLGFALFHASAAMVLFTAFAAFVVQIFIVGFEEPQLEQRFGENYLQYKRDVGRWLPKKP